MNKYIPVIGLEIHVELKTKCKMFCQCQSYVFETKPNTHVCPVCLGLPGALPVPNREAIEWTIKIAQALNCMINTNTKFDRKHYSYPDLPKGYQISQYDQPIAINGSLKLKCQMSSFDKTQDDPERQSNGSNVKCTGNNIQSVYTEKVFRIHRVHLEEDTGKLTHSGEDTLVDFNRSGTTLVEIVTEPDFTSSEDVKMFLEELHTIIRYLEVSDADMEKGTMRMEPNISVRIISNVKSQMSNQKQNLNFQLPNYKVEVKNINSFNFVKRAIDFEVKRHIELLEQGKTPVQETRGWNSNKNITYSQRSKEQAHDYRYFPEPDIPPFEFSNEYIESIRKTLPELPQAKMFRFIDKSKLKPRDAYTLTREKDVANYFEKVMSKVKGQMSKVQVKSKNLEQDIANLIINKKIPISILVEDFVKKAVEMMQPIETDIKLLDEVVQRVISINQKSVSDYKAGKQNAIMFLVGQVMREMKGKADAIRVKSELEKKING